MSISTSVLDLCFSSNDPISNQNNIELLCNELCLTSMEQLVLIALTQSSLTEISAKNIPQFSNFYDGAYRTTQIVADAHDMKLDYIVVGKMLRPIGKKDVAYRKYGENHLKLAHELGLIRISKGFIIGPTSLGEVSLRMDQLNFDKLSSRLILRIPVVRELIKKLVCGPVSTIDYLNQYLSKSTSIRRASNLRFLVKKVIYDVEGQEVRSTILGNLR